MSELLQSLAVDPADGSLGTPAALLLGLALALVAGAAARAAGLARTAPWLVVAALAQAASLQLVDAGSRLHYEHLSLATGAAWRPVEPLALVVLAGAALAVAAGARAHAGALAAGARFLLGRRPALAAAALALLGVATAAYPSREPGVFAREIALSLALWLLHLGAAAVLFAALHRDLASRRDALPQALASGPGAPARRPDAVALACALWVAAVASLLAVTVYDRHPHVTDEVAYLFHARSFAAGALSLPAPPVPEAFEIYLVQCEAGRCFAPTYPGWPAVLALGLRLGVPWLVNPLLGGLGVLLAFAVMRDLFDRRAARLTALLLAASPWHLLVSMSFMAHAFSLVCALFAAWGVVRTARGAGGRGAGLAWGLGAGAALGVLSLVRPLEALCWALLLGLAALAANGRGARAPLARRLVAAGALGVGALAAGSANLLYNRAMTGDPLAFPIMVYADQALGEGRNALGFGPDKGMDWGGIDPFPGHGLRDAAVNAQLNTTGLQRELFGWAVGSLLPVALALVTGRLRRRDGWLLLAAVATPAAHTFYWYSGGPDFGARYWYLSIAPLVALTARSLLALADEAAAPAARRLAWLGPVALSAVALLVFLPWRAVDKYTYFRGMRADVRALLASGALAGRPLVLVRGPDYPDAASALIYNPPDPEADAPLFVWARDAETEARLRAAHPDRPVRVLEGPSTTGGAYRLRPEEAAAPPSSAPPSSEPPSREPAGSVHQRPATAAAPSASGTSATGPSGR